MWKICDRLYLGDRRTAADKRALVKAGVTHVVNCTSDLPCSFPADFEYFQIRLSAQGSEFSSRMDSLCRFIDAGREDGAVLIHCSEARQRSPAAVIAYLCHSGKTVEEAIQLMREALRDRRPKFTPPPWGLMQHILTYYDQW